MPKKTSSNKQKSFSTCSSEEPISHTLLQHLKSVEENYDEYLNWVFHNDHPYGETIIKSWLTTSKRCNKKQPQYPQITEVSFTDPIRDEENMEIDPYDAKSRPMKFTNIITSGYGIQYALSLQGCLVVMEDDGMTIKGRCRTRAVPSVSTKYFKDYLFEADIDELWLVFLIYRKYIGVVEDVEIFRFTVDRLELVKVEKLQGRALFLDETGSIVFGLSRKLSVVRVIVSTSQGGRVTVRKSGGCMIWKVNQFRLHKSGRRRNNRH